MEAAGTDEARETTYAYDDNNNLITTTQVGKNGALDAVTRMAYDDFGNMSRLTDPEANVTTFTHDVMGNVLIRTDALENQWQYLYDPAGNLIDTIDPDERVTHYEYDAVGRKILKRDPLLRETHFEYDHHNNMTAMIDQLGNATRFTYTFDGKLLSQTDPEGRITRYEYDAEGRLVKTIDAAGNIIETVYDDLGTGCGSCSSGGLSQPERIIFPTFTRTFAYDQRGRKVTETDVLSPTELLATSYTYDDAGQLKSRTDKEQKTVYYDYDNLGRLLTVTAPASSITHYAYDSRDNLISLIDGEGHETRFEYDLNNRLVREIRPMGQETTYQYDGLGNLTEKIDSKNQKTQYGYDNTGRLQAIRYYAHAGDTTAAKTVTFDYDELGNLTGYDDGVTSATYNYDELSRKIGEEVNYDGFTLANTITYNKDNRKKTFTGPDGVVYTYQYDAGGHLSGIQIPNVGFVTIGEYTWNRPASMTLPGGTRKTYAYDPLMRVKQISTLDPGGNLLLDYSYGYDKMDNIATRTTEHGAYAYAYDDLYRLTAADNPTETDETFTYDTVGNRLTSTDTTSTWGYNQNNELGGYDDVSYEYDANGNMIKKTVGSVVTSYVYNIENRLIEVWNGEAGSGSLTASYYYDPFGRRLWKEVGGVRTHFHYTDEGLIGEYDAAGSELRTYGYKPGSTWTTDPMFMKDAGKYYFYHNDHLGTPQKMTAVNGAVVWSATYSSFLKADADLSSAIENNLRAPGQYEDAETGLHYNWNRYYDPETGRYISADPIGLDGGGNLYVYTENDPINGFDITGLCKWTGWMSYAGVSIGIFGGLYVQFNLESECCNGYKIINAVYRGFTGGLSLGIPVQAAQTPVELEGPDNPGERDGQGAISYVSLAGAIGGGYGAGWLGLGKLAGPQHGLVVWFDGGLDMMIGYASARGKGKKVECCDR